MALFGLGKKKETACCCGAGATPESMERAEDTKRESGVKVLGGGCAKCHELDELEANVKAALASLGLDQSVELITDFSVIAAYGVMSTPALVVDGKVVSYGKVLKRDEVATILKRERGL